MRSASTNFANRSYISVPVLLGGIQALALCSWGNSACLIALLNRITKQKCSNVLFVASQHLGSSAETVDEHTPQPWLTKAKLTRTVVASALAESRGGH